jgi:hypothetical protein
MPATHMITATIASVAPSVAHVTTNANPTTPKK